MLAVKSGPKWQNFNSWDWGFKDMSHGDSAYLNY